MLLPEALGAGGQPSDHMLEGVAIVTKLQHLHVHSRDSVSTTAPCHRTAVSSTDLNNATVLDAQVLPYVDGITATTALDPPAPADAPVFTFSASQDPGERVNAWSYQSFRVLSGPQVLQASCTVIPQLLGAAPCQGSAAKPGGTPESSSLC